MGPEADIETVGWDVCFSPITAVPTTLRSADGSASVLLRRKVKLVSTEDTGFYRALGD
jgi:hypothetical protein